MNTVLSVFLIIFLSHVVQTITGFAGAMLALPPLAFLVGITEGKIILLLIGIAWSLLIIFPDYKYINWNYVFISFLWMSAGTMLGLFISGKIPINFLLGVMALIIISFSCLNLLKLKSNNYTLRRNKFLKYLLLILAGVFQGLVLMGGPFLVAATANELSEKKQYRVTLSIIWLLQDLIIIVQYYLKEAIDLKIILLVGLCLGPLILSIIIGNWLFKIINNYAFKYVTYITLLITGVIIFLKIYF